MPLQISNKMAEEVAKVLTPGIVGWGNNIDTARRALEAVKPMLERDFQDDLLSALQSDNAVDTLARIRLRLSLDTYEERSWSPVAVEARAQAKESLEEFAELVKVIL